MQRKVRAGPDEWKSHQTESQHLAVPPLILLGGFQEASGARPASSRPVEAEGADGMLGGGGRDGVCL